MRPLSLLSAAVALFAVNHLPAADLRLLPAEVTLTGPQASQRLVLVADDKGQVVGQRADAVTFTTSDATIVAVEKDGTLSPKGDGEATVTATHGNQKAVAKVKVARFKDPFTWSFNQHVIPMMTRAGCNSGACHGALAGKGGLKLSLRGYDSDADHFVLTRQAGARRVDRVEPSRSLLLRKPTLAVSHGGGQRIDVGSRDFRVLADWIAAGAPGPRKDEPALSRIEVLPAASLLKPKDEVQVVVRGWYADGHSEDVTRWAKFSSSEDLVAGVDADGLVKVTGHGEAAISVWYSNRVASARVTVPLPNKVDAKVFKDSPRKSYIDDLVLRKLEGLRIPPSPACTDAEFVRRAYLDAAGILPTPDEVKKFIADPSPEKRDKLVDALLERPEFVDYWAYKWSDLLLVNSRRLAQANVWAFYQHIRQAVADNTPWDRFARDVLTVKGTALQHGAANYFVLHKDVTDLTESTSVTFMGMSITCARCHNHPLEKWTQDQYWGMANLFSRVALKNGDRPGDVLVQEQTVGDVPHPRRGVAMPPTPLDAEPLTDVKADRRKYFTDWLTSKDNPYFARALVNRVWRNFMGRGLVEAEDDLRETNPPTNPELLDALAADFVKHGYDVKHVVRTVMKSAAYQRSSKATAGNETDDRFYSRYLLRRLPAEVILDAYSQVTGVPTPFNKVDTGGTGRASDYNGYPLGTRALQLPDSQVASRFLDAFGRPERGQTCSCERQQDSSVGQALHVNNGQTLNDKLRAKESRLTAWVADKVGDAEAVERVYSLALGRTPTEAELSKFKAILAEAAGEGADRREALEDLFWGVLSSKEFLFNR